MPRIEKIITNKNASRQDNKTVEERLVDRPTQAGSGIGCSSKFETLPEYITAECENVISNANSFIVLGRDRPNTRLSGYGGIGAASAHSIDLVVGRKAPGAPKDQKVYVDPNFILDSARIHISERTDVDRNFKITAGYNGDTTNRSAIALKADALRLMADDGGIKLVTRVNNRNSNGILVGRVGGVELIAGNDDSDLQSMVKGENLVNFLNKIIDQINTLNGIVMSMTTAMTIFEFGLLSHFHPPGSPSPVLPPFVSAKVNSNVQTLLKASMQKINLAAESINSLASLGSNDILSSYHKVN